MVAAMQPKVAMTCVLLLWSEVWTVASCCVVVEARLSAVRTCVATARPTLGHEVMVLSLQVWAAMLESRGTAELHFRADCQQQPIILL